MELHQQTVRREVELDADLASAWDALADPRRLEEWLADAVDLEIEAGASGTVTDHDGTVRDTVVEEVVPERRLALRWAAPGEAPTIVDITLDPLPGGRTRLVVVELPAALTHAVSEYAVTVTRQAATGPSLVAA